MVGGPIAIIENGDTITIDADSNEINLEISDEEIQKRLSAWKAPEPNVTRGVLANTLKPLALHRKAQLQISFRYRLFKTCPTGCACQQTAGLERAYKFEWCLHLCGQVALELYVYCAQPVTSWQQRSTMLIAFPILYLNTT